MTCSDHYPLPHAVTVNCLNCGHRGGGKGGITARVRPRGQEGRGQEGRGQEGRGQEGRGQDKRGHLQVWGYEAGDRGLGTNIASLTTHSPMGRWPSGKDSTIPGQLFNVEHH